jgi:hypothetical protein
MTPATLLSSSPSPFFCRSPSLPSLPQAGGIDIASRLGVSMWRVGRGHRVFAFGVLFAFFPPPCPCTVFTFTAAFAFAFAPPLPLSHPPPLLILHPPTCQHVTARTTSRRSTSMPCWFVLHSPYEHGCPLMFAFAFMTGPLVFAFTTGPLVFAFTTGPSCLCLQLPTPLRL